MQLTKRNGESKFGIMRGIIDKLGIICIVNANLETIQNYLIV